ncbi:hypothetical protein ACRALDRAFT_208996 [Sodiomyces alcalophilus JCM 7366]|uniref:uncharacterized protein n=1 Tax=Sodiomyces alcalophilus JCM 7366 TaxID=591952 RepID=UPI0039B3D890
MVASIPTCPPRHAFPSLMGEGNHPDSFMTPTKLDPQRQGRKCSHPSAVPWCLPRRVIHRLAI